MANRADRRAAQRQAVAQARNVLQRLSSGRLEVADLERQTADEARIQFSTVEGPGDPMWESHVEIARRVLSLNGLPADEVGEWAAVIASAEAAEREDSEAETEPEPEPVTEV